MTTKTSCVRCGAALPENAPEGLCPNCLLARGLDLMATPDGLHCADAPTLTSADAPTRVSAPVTPFTCTKLRYFGRLRIAKGVTGETEFIVIGSQAILGPFRLRKTPLCESGWP